METEDKEMKKQGFFVKINNDYAGPYDSLNEAREEAKKAGPNTPIYHGVLKGEDDSELHIIPKVEKSEFLSKVCK